MDKSQGGMERARDIANISSTSAHPSHYVLKMNLYFCLHNSNIL